MLEITSKSCYKCDLETIVDNNSQYFWINLKDFEAETESKWLNMFNKHGNTLPFKYRRELTSNIKFQAVRIFVRNDLFEQVIKSCKATNIEFTILKEKLGICPYEENYYTEDKVLINEPDKVLIDKVLINQPENKSFNEPDNKSINEKVNSNSTSWYDTDKFNKILATIDNNNFNHKNKISKLKFNEINDLINSIKGNTISEADTKKNLMN